ncbi:DUF7111 family protein [Natronobiforma cellulositropha]|uniref:DUF7111 family protein n=1 Tax=Natronobiforma cellulositropha TaxID=1679076 RepID=UPI0021D5A339|nr:hypothetical protein [Natronobiforma cellulositropha]
MTDTSGTDRREADGITATYAETDRERVLAFEREGTAVEVAQNRDGYAMVAVRDAVEGELERYYGLDMALDHVGELLGVSPSSLPVPDAARDMGM